MHAFHFLPLPSLPLPLLSPRHAPSKKIPLRHFLFFFLLRFLSPHPPTQPPLRPLLILPSIPQPHLLVLDLPPHIRLQTGVWSGGTGFGLISSSGTVGEGMGGRGKRGGGEGKKRGRERGRRWGRRGGRGVPHSTSPNLSNFRSESRI